MANPDPASTTSVAVVVPCYRVTPHILGVIARMPACVQAIFVVDDACPDGTAAHVQQHNLDPRVTVLIHTQNQGVGGATLTGYRAAIDRGFDIIVKVDGDGQMDPAFIPTLIRPIINERADYTKGTRFYSVGTARQMPLVRLVGNIALSFISKLTSGYWSVMDPTNGFTAIHRRVLALFPLKHIEKRYFFESDMLYHCGLLRAVVVDVPMFARYGDEVSSLKISRVLLDFPARFAARAIKRWAYAYVLRDFNMGSVGLLLGGPMLMFGVVFGGLAWWRSAVAGVPTPAGTVMLAALPLLLGTQLIISAVLYDMANQPKTVLHSTLPDD